MDETANEIEARIDTTRERLGSKLRELEERVDAATDWREQFRDRPQLFLSVAVVGGVILATMLRSKSSGRGAPDTRAKAALNGSGAVREQALEFWHNVQAALIGVTTARLKEYMGQLVPGFDEHYRRAEQRAAAFDPTTHSLGRTTS